MAIITSRPDFDEGFYIDEEPPEGSGDEDVENLLDLVQKETREWIEKKSVILGKEQAS